MRIRKLLELRRQLQRHYQYVAGLQEPNPADTLPEQQPENAFVRQVREVVAAHLADFNFNVEQLCRAVFMSHSHLHRKLDALTGLSPTHFIRMIRLNEAKRRLRDTRDTVSTVALDCGFQDPSYIARVFRQEFGVTPAVWRDGGG